MSRRIILFVIVAGLLLGGSAPPASSAAAVASSIGKAIAKYFGKEGTEQATEYMTRQGGKEIVERVTSTAARQGGDEAVQQVAKLAAKHGPDAIAALDNSPSLLPILRALDELPESQVSAALARLSAGAPGRELAETVNRFGVAALRSELKHPGVGMVLVRTLGDDGADLAARLSSDQAIALGRHADDLAKLPDAQRAGVLGMLRSDADRMLTFIGKFVEDNPGKSLFTVAATSVILAQPERILGGDEVVFDADGNPIVVSKAGLVGRSMDASGNVASHVSDKYLQPVFFAVMAFVGVLAAIWSIIKIWQFRMLKRASLKRIASKH
jgi:hypothetical protein